MWNYYLAMRNVIELWLSDEDGQDLTEYALLLFLIVVAAVAAVTALGDEIVAVMEAAAAALGGALGG